MAENQVAVNPSNAVFGGLPNQFGFKWSMLNQTPTAIPYTGTNQFGVPGNSAPQTSNVQTSSVPNATAQASNAVASGPFSQPAFIALLMTVIGVSILAVVAHLESR